MPFMTTEELQKHHRHLLNSLALLDKAAPDWTKADRKRAEATRINLQQELTRVGDELHMAGQRRRSA